MLRGIKRQRSPSSTSSTPPSSRLYRPLPKRRLPLPSQPHPRESLLHHRSPSPSLALWSETENDTDPDTDLGTSLSDLGLISSPSSQNSHEREDEEIDASLLHSHNSDSPISKNLSDSPLLESDSSAQSPTPDRWREKGKGIDPREYGALHFGSRDMKEKYPTVWGMKRRCNSTDIGLARGRDERYIGEKEGLGLPVNGVKRGYGLIVIEEEVSDQIGYSPRGKGKGKFGKRCRSSGSDGEGDDEFELDLPKCKRIIKRPRPSPLDIRSSQLTPKTILAPTASIVNLTQRMTDLAAASSHQLMVVSEVESDPDSDDDSRLVSASLPLVPCSPAGPKYLKKSQALRHPRGMDKARKITRRRAHRRDVYTTLPNTTLIPKPSSKRHAEFDSKDSDSPMDISDVETQTCLVAPVHKEPRENKITRRPKHIYTPERLPGQKATTHLHRYSPTSLLPMREKRNLILNRNTRFERRGKFRLSLTPGQVNLAVLQVQISDRLRRNQLVRAHNERHENGEWRKGVGKWFGYEVVLPDIQALLIKHGMVQLPLGPIQHSQNSTVDEVAEVDNELGDDSDEEMDDSTVEQTLDVVVSIPADHHKISNSISPCSSLPSTPFLLPSLMSRSPSPPSTPCPPPSINTTIIVPGGISIPEQTTNIIYSRPNDGAPPLPNPPTAMKRSCSHLSSVEDISVRWGRRNELRFSEELREYQIHLREIAQQRRVQRRAREREAAELRRRQEQRRREEEEEAILRREEQERLMREEAESLLRIQIASQLETERLSRISRHPRYSQINSRTDVTMYEQFSPSSTPDEMVDDITMTEENLLGSPPRYYPDLSHRQIQRPIPSRSLTQPSPRTCSPPRYRRQMYGIRTPSPPPPYNASTDRQTLIAPIFIDDSDDEDILPPLMTTNRTSSIPRLVPTTRFSSNSHHSSSRHSSPPLTRDNRRLTQFPSNTLDMVGAFPTRSNSGRRISNFTIPNMTSGISTEGIREGYLTRQVEDGRHTADAFDVGPEVEEGWMGDDDDGDEEGGEDEPSQEVQFAGAAALGALRRWLGGWVS
ncbi:hypothetical protein M231_00277 [Tremella mesenterica]|uniref:Uncharacterized protein n=1 Tax=Tremella mesenterica TaxID=5217 RepID=A0A4V1M515_TREME|nr:hypothetical protein M231_00277 [Tremella mesenterica]